MASKTEINILTNASIHLEAGLDEIAILRRVILDQRNVEVEAENEIRPESGVILNSLANIKNVLLKSQADLPILARRA